MKPDRDPERLDCIDTVWCYFLHCLLNAVHVFLLFLCICFETGLSDTQVEVTVGSRRSLNLSWEAERVVNHAPEIIRVTRMQSRTRVLISALAEGEGFVEAIRSPASGAASDTRVFRIRVRARKKASIKERVKVPRDEGMKFSRLAPEFQVDSTSDGIIVSGGIESLDQFRRLARLSLLRPIKFHLSQELLPDVAMQIAFDLNRRAASTGRGRVFFDEEIGNFVYVKDSLKQSKAENDDVSALLQRIFPGHLVLKEDETNERYHVQVSLYLMESLNSESSRDDLQFLNSRGRLDLNLAELASSPVPIRLLLSSIAASGSVRVLERPTVVVRSGKEGKLFAGGERGFSQESTATDGRVVRSTAFQPYGLVAEVLPHVLSDGRVNVRLQIELSEPQVRNDEQELGILGQSKREISSDVTVRQGLATLVAQVSTRNHQSSRQSDGAIPILSAFSGMRFFRHEERRLFLFLSVETDQIPANLRIEGASRAREQKPLREELDVLFD